jgi:putative ABC transport system ATP-binding protein
VLTHTSTAARPATDIAVSARRVSRQYGDGDSAVNALRGVSLEVPTGQFTAVMGPSGSGKSTLMHLLAGLDRPTNGRVKIGGEDITEMPDKQLTRLRRRHIGFVFQQFNLLPMLTAEENILLPLSIAGRKPDKAAVASLIARVGLGERLKHKPSQLSGGQQQRVAIARALASRPTVLFADEPTGNLDSTSGTEVLALLREAVELDRQTTVMVTHDPRAAAAADRVLFLADGEIVNDLASPSEEQILVAVKERGGAGDEAPRAEAVHR